MTERLAERLGWWIVPASIGFWVLLWPLAIVWLAARGVRRAIEHRRETTPVERRVARLVRLYPASWRERYGDEFAELLRESIADGRDGPRLTLDVARGALVMRREQLLSRRSLAMACLTLCWIPLFPQGLVALGFEAFDAPVRSWFLALHVPDPFGYVVSAAMILLGAGLLVTGVRSARRLVALPATFHR